MTELCRAVKLKNNMNNPEIKACPFCGTLPSYGEKECHGSGKPMNAWWVMCPYCQATGPTRGNSIEAMLEWNKRVGVRKPAERNK
jgi:hypothetical protein